MKLGKKLFYIVDVLANVDIYVFVIFKSLLGKPLSGTLLPGNFKDENIFRLFDWRIIQI
jgi:hypothetical protein